MRAPYFGVGFRARHFDEVVARPRAVDWLELVAEHCLDAGGPRRAMVERLRADHPVALHGVTLSIAGTGPLPADYLRGLRALVDWLAPEWVSDHLCWTALGGHQSHDLLPVAYTREVLAHVAARVARVQDVLGRRLLLENPSAYVAFRAADMDEATFLAALVRRTGCGVLLDVNNLAVNAANLGMDPRRYLATLPAGAVGYVHLAGHAVLPDVRIDTHDADVPPAVWQLYDEVARRFPQADLVIERDDAAPAFAALVAEAARARLHHAVATAAVPPPAPRPARATAVATRAAVAPRRWVALQRRFWRRLVDKPVGFDHARDRGLSRLLDGARPVGAARGMRVYSDAYTASLREALATNFPTLACVLGAADFDRLAAAYLRRHPPAGHDFRRLGAHLAAFVRTHRFAADYGVPAAVLAEIVALEQAQLEASGAPDDAAAPLAPAALAAIAPARWAGARFGFAPALRIVHATHDVLPAIEAVAQGRTPPRPRAASGAYLVYRAGAGLRTERLDAREARILAALVAGAPFGAACVLADVGGDAAAVEAGTRAIVGAAARGLVRTPGGAGAAAAPARWQSAAPNPLTPAARSR